MVIWIRVSIDYRFNDKSAYNFTGKFTCKFPYKKEGSMNIILASKSPRREELMRFLTNSFAVIPSDFPEREVMYAGDPYRYTEELGLKKALQVAENHREDLVIGSDTVVVQDGELFNKPLDLEDARRMIRSLQGSWHEVVTSYALVALDKGIEAVGHVSTKVLFNAMTELEIETYLKTDDYAGKAGAYAVQGAASRYIARIEGDFYTVVGLPLSALYKELKAHGIIREDDVPYSGL